MMLIRLPSIIAIVLAAWLAWTHATVNAASARSGYDQLAQSTQTSPPGAEWHPTRAQVRDVQVRLSELHFDPGPPDGILGPQTIAAIRAYQWSIDVEPDGRLTKDLHDRLMGRHDETPQPSAMPGPPEPAQQMKPIDPGAKRNLGGCPPPSGNIWEFEDSHGSRFKLTLRDDGSVEGPPHPRHWRWQPTDVGIAIYYDNGMGSTVTRYGLLEGDDRIMVGEAVDSRGRSWAWTAERLEPLPGRKAAGC